ncbi:ABC transporter ATP-binding protein [Rathayibacter oskolensis]|uniref:ABC transporter ATP-binding protein n=1 Tax=Rathayibacter oskolensis TaxID=1891671 RepID=UPI003F5D516B
MYTLTNVSKSYDGAKTTVTALKNVTLSIPDGQMVAIQGPTGGGKSTLLQMLGALDRPTSGTVVLGEDEISSAGDGRLAAVRAKEVGIVFQSFNLIPTLTALENVETALAPQRVPAAERASRARRPSPPSGWPTASTTCPPSSRAVSSSASPSLALW